MRIFKITHERSETTGVRIFILVHMPEDMKSTKLRQYADPEQDDSSDTDEMMEDSKEREFQFKESMLDPIRHQDFDPELFDNFSYYVPRGFVFVFDQQFFHLAYAVHKTLYQR